MNRTVMFDTGILGKIVHPRPQPEVASWLLALLGSGAKVILRVQSWSDIT